MKPPKNPVVRDAMQRAIASDPSEGARDLGYSLALRQRAERMQPRAAARTSPNYNMKGRRAP